MMVRGTMKPCSAGEEEEYLYVFVYLGMEL